MFLSLQIFQVSLSYCTTGDGTNHLVLANQTSYQYAPQYIHSASVFAVFTFLWNVLANQILLFTQAAHNSKLGKYTKNLNTLSPSKILKAHMKDAVRSLCSQLHYINMYQKKIKMQDCGFHWWHSLLIQDICFQLPSVCTNLNKALKTNKLQLLQGSVLGLLLFLNYLLPLGHIFRWYGIQFIWYEDCSQL